MVKWSVHLKAGDWGSIPFSTTHNFIIHLHRVYTQKRNVHLISRNMFDWNKPRRSRHSHQRLGNSSGFCRTHLRWFCEIDQHGSAIAPQESHSIMIESIVVRSTEMRFVRTNNFSDLCVNLRNKRKWCHVFVRTYLDFTVGFHGHGPW